MRFLENDRVLCLSPHPDDVEYSMAGTIIKFKDTQFDILCLSQGGAVDSTTSKNRLDEVDNFWKDVENVKIIYIESNISNYREDVLINKIEGMDMDYDAIFIPCREDNHFFHKHISSLGRSLCRVKKFNLYEYFTPSAESTWTSNLSVEINNLYENKKERLLSFKSQSNHKYFSEFCLNAFHSDLHYNKKGFGWIEKFKVLNHHI